MKKRKIIRLATVFAVLFAVFCQSLLGVLAAKFSDAEEVIDLSKSCSLTVVCRNSEDDFSDLPVSVYKVADLTSEYTYVPVGAFASYPISFNYAESTAEWDALTQTVENYVSADSISPDYQSVTDKNGSALLKNIPAALYLVSVDCSSISGAFAPFLVFVPTLGEDKLWKYDSVVYPKYSGAEPDDEEYKVIKEWEDGMSPDRPDFVTVEIKRDGEYFERVTLNDENAWAYIWRTAPGHTWAVEEIVVPEGYTPSVAREDNTFIVTNTKEGDTPEDESFRVVKKWVDGGSKDRPTSVEVVITCDGSEYKTITLDESDAWAFEWTYETGHEWAVEEKNVPENYECLVEKHSKSFIVINTLKEDVPEYESFKVVKEWYDNNSPDRPASVKVNIIRDGELFKEITLSLDNSWLYEWESEVGYDWTVEEIVPEDYKCELVTIGNLFILKNTSEITPPSPEKEYYKVVKNWRTIPGQSLPDGIDVTILRDGVLYDTVTLSEGNHWTFEWETDAGYSWLVLEPEVPEHFKVSYERAGNTFIVNNTFVPEPPPYPELETYKVVKVWDDDGDENRPESVTVIVNRDGEFCYKAVLSDENAWIFTWESFEGYNWTVEEETVPDNYEVKYENNEFTFVITNTRIVPPPVMETYRVVKVWDDDNNANRPESVEVEIKCDGELYKTVVLSDENGWAFEWTAEEGHEWKVSELNVAKYYEAKVELADKVFVVTNTYNPPIEEYKVVKVWDDDNYESRPESVNIIVNRDGEFCYKATLSDENNWLFTWESFEGYEWTVVEENVPENYEVKYAKNGFTFVVTNTRIIPPPEKETYRVVKIWDDGDNANRPASVEIKINKDGAEFEKVTLSAENNWAYEWETDKGFTWTAEEINVPEGYEVKVELADKVFVVTNKLLPPKTETYKVMKQWRDDDVNLRPASVEVEIYKDGTLYEKVTLSADNKWMYEWETELDHKWNVVERNVPKDYTVSIENKDNTFIVTNTAVEVPPEPPKDGDTSNTYLYVIAMAVAGIALIALGAYGRKRVYER